MKHLMMIVLALCVGATAHAQQAAQPTPQPTPAPAQPAPSRVVPANENEAVNVRYEIRILEEGGPEPSTTKIVSMAATRYAVSAVRANPSSRNPLNVDVTPTGLLDGKVQTKIGIEYTAQSPGSSQRAGGVPPVEVRQTVNVWLESGTPMVISHAADPLSDRRVTVEVTATVLK
jgi:hypothetical protein